MNRTILFSICGSGSHSRWNVARTIPSLFPTLPLALNKFQTESHVWCDAPNSFLIDVCVSVCSCGDRWCCCHRIVSIQPSANNPNEKRDQQQNTIRQLYAMHHKHTYARRLTHKFMIHIYVFYTFCHWQSFHLYVNAPCAMCVYMRRVHSLNTPNEQTNSKKKNKERKMYNRRLGHRQRHPNNEIWKAKNI